MCESGEGGWGGGLFVSVYLHISLPLRGPSRGSVYLEIGRLPKQCISYSQGHHM